MTKLAEAYFRLGIHLEKADIDRFKAFLMEAAHRNASGLFKQTAEVAVYLEEGSLRGWITIAGLLLVGIEGYGSFRTGVDYLVHDGRPFSEAMFATVKQTGVLESEILRTERRTGVPGKLSRLLAGIDYLERHGRDLSKAEYEERLDNLRDRTVKIIRLVEEEEDRKMIIGHIRAPVRDTLPTHLPRPPVGGDLPIALRPEEFELRGPSFGTWLSLAGDKNRQNTLPTRFVPLSDPNIGVTHQNDPTYRVEVTANGARLVRVQ